MQQEQTVAEMAQEVLARQAEVLAHPGAGKRKAGPLSGGGRLRGRPA